MSELKELKTAEYQDLVNQGGVTVIDFWAPWCGYCVRMMPIIEEIAGELEGKANFVKVNADEEPELARNANIRYFKRWRSSRPQNWLHAKRRPSRCY